MDREYVDKFNKMYSEVFAEDGSVKNCGRKATSELIVLSKTIRPTMNFGDERTGFMNISAIQTLHTELITAVER